MLRLSLRLFGVAALCFCMDFPGNAVLGAAPPPARNRQEIEAVLAKAPNTPPVSELRPLQIVLVANRKDHGPHEHDYPLWMERWKVLLGGKESGDGRVNLYGPAFDLSQGPPTGAAKVSVQTAKDWPSPEQWAKADLVVAFFGTGGIWNEAKLRDLKGFLNRGGGFVAVHSTTIAEVPHARPLAESIGLAWEGGYTLFRHGPIDLKITAREHPICKGLPQQIHFEDETYWPLVGDASRIGLLATADEKAKDTGELRPQPMFWTCEVGKGRSYGCLLGHYTWTFDDPYFRILLLRGMAWAAGESPYRFDPLVLCGARTTDQKRAAAEIPAGVAPVAPNPNDPNLLLWLDASDKGSLTLSAEGRVSAWSNKAAKVGRKLTSTAAQQPLYVEKSLGGHPTVRFDGVDDVLRDTGFKQSAQTWTAVLVVTPTSNAGGGQFHALLATNRPGQNDFVTGLNLDLGPNETAEFSSLNLEGVKDAPGATNLRAETAPFGEGQILVLSTGNARSRLWINGTEEEGRAANDAVTAMDELRLGGRFYQNQERGFFHGDVSEVLIYKTELTDAQRLGLYSHLLKKYGLDIKRTAGHTLQDAWDYLPRYDWGTSRRPLAPIDEAIRSSRSDPQAYKTLEPRLLEALANPASTVAAKDFVSRRLAIVGSAASVPELAKLLSDEKLSNMACFALERIPSPAADDALRQALKSLPGNQRIAVIYALGNRRSQVALADLVRLLESGDAATRQAAATALGKIGGAEATKALLAALDTAPVSVRTNIADSCLKCAEQLSAAGRRGNAHSLYLQLEEQKISQTLQLAATRGVIRLCGSAVVDLLVDQLRSEDPKRQAMALLLIREIPNTNLMHLLALRIGDLPPDKKARAIAALADRTDPVPTDTLLVAIEDEHPSVRLAAVQALGRLGNASVVTELLTVATGIDRKLADAAVSSLSVLSGEKVDKALLEAFHDGDGKTRQAIIEVLGRRAYAPAIATLVASMRSPERLIRLAAIKALGETATAREIPSLVDVVVRGGNAQETGAAEVAIVTVFKRIDEKDACAETLSARWSQAQPAAKLALLRVLGRMGGSRALRAVQTASGDPNPEVQDAAIRALCDWASVEPADDLLKIARESKSDKYRMLALRGYVRMAGQEALPPERRLAMATQSLRLSTRDEERKLALGVLAGVPSQEALALVVPYLESGDLKEEAGAAAVAIAEKLLPNHPAPVAEAMEKVLKAVKTPDLLRRAAELKTRAR